MNEQNYAFDNILPNKDWSVQSDYEKLSDVNCHYSLGLYESSDDYDISCGTIQINDY